MKDLGVNFFLNEADLSSGLSRSVIVAPRLQELNPLCAVKVAADLNDAVILAHSAVVITELMRKSELIRINELCRTNGIAFFFSWTGGISMSVFSDLGTTHLVHDFNGERPVQKLITSISPVGDGECLVRYDTPEGQQPVALSQGFFEITEVVGVDGISGKTFAVSHPYSDPVKTVRIPLNISALNAYVSGGILTEKKRPTPYPMKSLAEKFKDPGNTFAEPPSLVLTDLINFGSELQQHVALVALLSYAEANGGRLPRPNNADDIADVVAEAKAVLSRGEVVIEDFTLDEDFVKRSV
jgi:hypothetical protein